MQDPSKSTPVPIEDFAILNAWQRCRLSVIALRWAGVLVKYCSPERNDRQYGKSIVHVAEEQRRQYVVHEGEEGPGRLCFGCRKFILWIHLYHYTTIGDQVMSSELDMRAVFVGKPAKATEHHQLPPAAPLQNLETVAIIATGTAEVLVAPQAVPVALEASPNSGRDQLLSQQGQ